MTKREPACRQARKQFFARLLVGLILMAVLLLIMYLTGNLPSRESP